MLRYFTILQLQLNFYCVGKVVPTPIVKLSPRIFLGRTVIVPHILTPEGTQIPQ
jgi:hypothetical protein